MKSLLVAGAALALFSVTAGSVIAQDTPKKPKNEVTKLKKARKTDRTTRQVTVDPKKSPAKHAKNLSKNINHELNRESKDVNKLAQGKKKKL